MRKRRLLTEFFMTENMRILEERLDETTRDPVMRVEVKWQQADVVNSNGRLYPRHVLQREIERLRPLVERGAVYGAAYHPRGIEAELDDVSHIWESVEMLDDGSCVGVVKVLPTEKGRNAQVLIRHGGRIGLSSRGVGDVVRRKMKVDGREIEYDEVAENYVLKSPGDFVLSPSVPDAEVRRILERRYSSAECSELSQEEEEEEETMEGGEMRMVKTMDELRSTYPELIRSLDEQIERLNDENAVLKSEVERLKEEMATLSTTLETTQKTVESLTADATSYVEVIRNVITTLSDLKGVIPEAAETTTMKVATEEKREEVVSETTATTLPNDELLRLREELEMMRREYSRMEEELKKVQEERAEEERKRQIREAVEMALQAKEYQPYADAIRREMETVVIGAVEEVEPMLKAIKEKISKTIVELKRQEIVRDIGQKGRIEAAADERLTEEELRGRYRSAIRAGFRGTFDDYRKTLRE